MATTYVDYVPSATGPFQFQPTLDGAVYACIVYWNLAGQRNYIQCTSLSGTPIFNQAVVGSPLDYNISLTSGYFDTQLVWRIANNQFEIIDA